jgi:cytidine deaminase
MPDKRLCDLFDKAMEAASRAYAPYSNFHVGAAVLCTDGEIFTGANVENRSYGLTICAERSAIAAAVSAGKLDFTALAVATPDSNGPVPPCGACRQVISEFSRKDMPVIFGDDRSRIVSSTVEELYPLDSLHELAGS